MVPQKIILEGFLCYGSQQEVDLSDLPLCMLAGPNGSGKSTVFDAITFALFGIHRGGSQNLEDLINKKADAANVTFEFLLDGECWQIYRTVQRSGRTTRCVKQLITANDKQTWQIVPDTSASAGFKCWIESKLPLSGKAFMSSMLLRQGESDRLLSADPKDRFEVLAGIMELDRFQELERAAKDRHTLTQSEIARVAAQLAGIVSATDEELSEAEKDSTEAGAKASEAEHLIGSLQEHHAQSRIWSALNAKLDEGIQRRRTLKDLISGARCIESEYARLNSLDAALPHLSEILDQRLTVAGSLQRCGQISAERDHNLRSLQTKGAEAIAIEKQGSEWEPLVVQLETTGVDLGRKIGESRRVLDLAEATDRQRKSLDELDARLDRFAKKHSNPEGELSRAREESRRLMNLKNALPALARFCEWRRTGVESTTQREKADAERQTTQAELDEVSAKYQSTQRELEIAEAAARESQKKETEAQTILKRARESLVELDKAEGKPTCPACGQPLTESHLEQERKRRQGETAQWNTTKATATQARQQAEAKLKQLRSAGADLDKQQRNLADRIQKHASALDHSNVQIIQAAKECKKAYAELPENLRSQISPSPAKDWGTTTWPSEDDLNLLEQEAARHAPAEHIANELDGLCTQVRTLTAQASALRETLSSHGETIPGDLDGLRNAHAKLEADRVEIEKRLGDVRDSFRRGQQTQKTLTANVRELETALAKLDRELHVEEIRRAGAEQIVGRASGQLPSDWTESAIDLTAIQIKDWKKEAVELDRRGVRESFEKLKTALAATEEFEHRIREIESDIARIPEPSRRNPDAIALELDQAKTARAKLETAHRQAELRHSDLRAARARRQELEQARRQSDRHLRHLKLLCDLLGKKRLQLYLVRQTEAKIVECANRILERLSAGGLYLQLRNATVDNADDATDHALDLMAINRATAGGEPFAVAFLSGSQRFRVAVSLALAIGQAAGNDRSGECVIIDEGFGSLDLAGQDVMIQELRQLQGIMKRIILVSHQESFAEAFPHGYRFRIVDGEARVERMSA